MTTKSLQNNSSRASTGDDAALRAARDSNLHENLRRKGLGQLEWSCHLDLLFDKTFRLARLDIGIIGVDRRSDYWFLDKHYLLPSYQNQGLAAICGNA
jgi:hypothetical protein